MTTYHQLAITITVCCYLLQSAQSSNIPTRFFYNNEGNSQLSALADADSLKLTEGGTVAETEQPQLKLLANNSNGIGTDTDADTGGGNKAKNEPIPMAFYEQVDNVTDINEFMELFANTQGNELLPEKQANAKRSVDRASVIVPKPANCMPALTVVPLTPTEPSKDPRIIYYPKCTRVKRCGGCCTSELMACQPVEIDEINYEITKYHYGERNPLVGKEIVTVEEHKRCGCTCRVKAEDCKASQVFRPDLCRCICTNESALQTCLEEEQKIWDDQECRCVCRESQNCTTGLIFDENQCKCVSDPESETTQLQRQGFVPSIPIEPSDSTLYHTTK